jgi:hypothetical protein
MPYVKDFGVARRPREHPTQRNESTGSKDTRTEGRRGDTNRKNNKEMAERQRKERKE